MTTYEDLLCKKVWARLRDVYHPECQIRTVYEIVSAGIKLKSERTNELFIVGNNDVRDDLRLLTAFVPWEVEQKPYTGVLILLIYLCRQSTQSNNILFVSICLRFELWRGVRKRRNWRLW